MHGSLARAGKVRAQTPKVEKQDKKKKPKGKTELSLLVIEQQDGNIKITISSYLKNFELRF